MKRKNLKSLIAMALTISTVVTLAGPTIAHANEISKAEYTAIFEQDTRAISSYEELREKWVELLTGNSLSGLNDSDAIANIKLMDEKVKLSLENADVSEGTPYVWEELVDSKSKSATITAQIKRLKEIAVAYKTKDSKYYNNQELLELILKGTNKMYSKHYNENVTSMPNNWWDWQIGAPKELVDIIVLMDSELGELKTSLIKTIDRFIPDPTKRVGYSSSFKETGANLIDKSQIVAVRGVVEGNDERVKVAADAIKEVFPYVIKGDGFYTDGSFIQHNNIAYTGSYGAVLLNGLSNCLYIIQDTEYKIDTQDYYNLFRWIKDSYEPVMTIGGNIMDNVRGRAISRINQQGDVRGKFIIAAMLRIANIAPNKEAENYINSITKRWLREGESASENYFSNLLAGDIANMKNVLNNNSIQESPNRNYYKQFYYMDRAVSNRPDYNFSVSMSSNRIANYETGNQEASRSWYTGQGMTQIYTSDTNQYNEDFWPTVDAMRLPGVTSDGQTRKAHASGAASDWAGGTTVDGINGVSGMEVLPTYPTNEGIASGMSARKSWFMFENEIVAVGSNISSDSKDVETIIDNRKIKDDATNKLLVDGEEVNSDLGEETVKANWAHLQGNVANSDIGYVFPKETEINTKRETRTHTWNEINKKPEFTDFEDKTRSYVSLAVDHGNSPSGSTYEYIILPNATSEETKDYSKNKSVEILANTNKVHAVYHKEEKIYAVNIFEPGKISDNIEVDAPVSMMIKENNGVYTFAVSNPTKKANSINLILNEAELEKYDVSGDVTVVDNIITIDSSRLSGETYKFTLSPKKVAVESITLDKTELDLKVGEKSKLTATINPENATDKNVVWSSENEKIATVDEEGNIEALAEGEVKIKATVDGKEATCLVKVEVAVESVTLDKTELALKVGEKSKLTATINPENATDKNVVWTSEDRSIVKVDEEGNIEALSEGEALIKATVEGKEATCLVKVEKLSNNETPDDNDKDDTNDDESNDKGDIDNDKDDISDNKDNGNSSSGNTSDDKDSSAKPPYTGDTSSVLVLGLTMLASAGGAFALKKKKNK